MIEFIDTKYDENYLTFMDLSLNTGQGLLLVFSINDYESFEFLKEIYKRIRSTKIENCPILLWGNKRDFEKERLVPYSEAKELANSWKIEYCEISTIVNPQ